MKKDGLNYIGIAEHSFDIPHWTDMTDIALSDRKGISSLWQELQFLVEPIYYSGRTPFIGNAPLHYNYASIPNRDRRQVTTSKIYNIANYAASTLTSFLIPAFEREIIIEPVVQIPQSKKWFKKLSVAVAELLKSPVTDFSNVIHSCLMTALHYGNCCLRILSKDGMFSLTEQDIYDVFIDLDYVTRDINTILWRQPNKKSYCLYKQVAHDNTEFVWQRSEGDNKDIYIKEHIYMTEIVYARLKRDVSTCYGVGPGIQNIALIDTIGQNIEKLQDIASYQARPAIVNFLNQKRLSFKEGTITTVNANMGSFISGGQPTAMVQKTFSDVQLKELTASFLSDLKNAYYSEVGMIPETPNMTATEVGARLEEKIGVLHPVVQNLQKELIYPIIMAAAQFVIQESRKANFENTYLTEDAPISVQQLTRSQIKYTSRFELMARKRHAEGLNVLTNAIAQASAIDPELKNIMNLEKYVDIVLETFSLDSGLLKNR